MSTTATDAASGRLPKYLHICDVLTGEIEAGTYLPGDPLPAQRALAERFGVTLMTVRQAIGVLESAGAVESRQGSGTFVQQARPADEPRQLRSLATELAAEGGELQTQVLASGLMPAPPGIAERLAVDPDGDVFVVERLRLLDGEPIVAQCSYLPGDIGLRLALGDLARRGLYESLAEDAGVIVARATETVRSVVLDPIDAAALGKDPGAAGLLLRRLSFDAADVPVIEDWAMLPGDRMVITVERVAGGSSGILDLTYSLTAGARP